MLTIYPLVKISTGTNDKTSVKLSEVHMKPEKDVEQKKTPMNLTGIEEKIHFHRNRTTFIKYLFGHVGEKYNRTQTKETDRVTNHLEPPSDIVGKIAEEILRKANISKEEANRELFRVEKVDEFVDREKEHERTLGQPLKEIHKVKKHPLPPSDIVGKVAEEILRKANITEEEADKELIRVEKVDKFIDKEKEHEERLNQPEHSFLEKLKESRGAGGKTSERKLVRVERVDLTDEEEELEDRKPEKPAQPAFENSRSRERTKSFRMRSTGISEDSELAHARRFGKTVAANTTLKSDTSAVESKEGQRNSSINETMKEVAITPPPFFAKFLNVTAQEREMIDFLNNYTSNSSVLDGRKSNISLRENGTEKEEHKMAKRIEMSSAHAHADKVSVREKREHKESDLHDTLEPLIAKLLNFTGDTQATNDNLKGPFNLSNILGKIAEGNEGMATKDPQSSLPDSTALLVRFLQKGRSNKLRKPKNDTVVHMEKDKSKFAGAKLGKNKLQPASERGINLKEILLELANHIDLTRHHNESKTSSERQERKADLMMLKLLLNQSTFQEYRAFNLSHVLKEIAENSVKSLVKRDKDASELGSTSAQSDLKIFRPVADELETSKTELIFNKEKKPNMSIKGEGGLASWNSSLNTTNVHMDSNKNNASYLSGSGSGESGDEPEQRFV